MASEDYIRWRIDIKARRNNSEKIDEYRMEEST
jgi:hypothetical protein